MSEGDPMKYEKIKYGSVEIYLAVLLSLNTRYKDKASQ